MLLKSGHKSVPLTEKQKKKIAETSNAKYAMDVAKFEPGGWVLLRDSPECLNKIYDFEFKPNDVLLMAFPKTGTTWTMEILWNLLHNSNLDNAKAYTSIDVRCSMLELDDSLKDQTKPVFSFDEEAEQELLSRRPQASTEDDLYLQLAESAPEPRTFKTHLSFPLLHPELLEKCRVVYVMRNPKDTIVSFYHFARLFKFINFKGDLDTFVDLFINDLLKFTPYWLHLKSAWENRHHPNLLICCYEDLKANTKAEVARIHDFLGLKLTENQLDQIVDFTSFAKLKERDNKTKDETFFNPEKLKETGGFFRKGINEDWKNAMTSSMSKKVDEWIKKNVEEFDSDFRYKI